MGVPPQSIEALSLWQYIAAVEGYNRANSGEGPSEPPTSDEYDEMLRRHGYR
jgi:hypothetical protein